MSNLFQLTANHVFWINDPLIAHYVHLTTLSQTGIALFVISQADRYLLQDVMTGLNKAWLALVNFHHDGEPWTNLPNKVLNQKEFSFKLEHRFGSMIESVLNNYY